MQDNSDLDRLLDMSEEEIEAGAKSDPDAPILTDSQLKSFKRVNPAKDVDVKKIRQKLELSQDKFALFFGISKRTLQEWEQNKRKPSIASMNFLKVVDYAPDVVQKALEDN